MSETSANDLPPPGPPGENAPTVRPGDDSRIRRLRLWPGIVAVAAYWVAIALAARLIPGSMAEFLLMLIGPIAVGVIVHVWWLAFSRAAMSERIGVVAAFVASAGVALAFRHPKVRLDGLIVLMLPYALTVWVAGAAVLAVLHRVRPWAISIGLLACAVGVCLVRIDGVTSALMAQTSWRWSPTKEDQLLATQERASAVGSDLPDLEARAGDWLEFRGPRRDGRLEGARIDTDWQTRPPREAWRRAIGPGWSSFAVVDGRIFTQEQRGQEEAVSCYDAATGGEVWMFRDRGRFEDFVSGAGPRATPTFHEGRLYALGAGGMLHCLDARTGTSIWSRDVAAAVGASPPMYGFASSPLVADGLVTVFAAGPEGKSVAAFHGDDGKLAWAAGEGLLGYCSVQREVFDGTVHYICTSNAGSLGIDPQSGRVLWTNAWPLEEQPRIVQPARVGPSQLLIGTGMADGVRLLEIQRGSAGDWQAREAWTTRSLKPYFNDFVLHDGCAFGYDGTLLSCLELDTQKRLWKKRGYDSGQILLLAEQGLLLIVTEKPADVVLLTADRRGPVELGRFRAFEEKTWNHPVVAHGRLYLRNGEEAACYELGEATND